MTEESYQQKIRDLEKALQEKNVYISYLEKLSEAYDRLAELTNQQLKDADSTLKAQEAVQNIMLKERIEAEMTIQAHENLEALSAAERQDSEQLLQAQENITRLSMQEIMNRDKALQNILEINKFISSILDEDQLMRNILQGLIDSVKAQRGVLYTVGDGSLRPKILIGIREEDIGEDIFRVSWDLIEETARTKTSGILIGHRAAGNAASAKLSAITTPLVHQGKFFGVLYVDILSEEELFKKNDLSLAEIFSAQAAVSMENARIYKELETLNKGLERKVTERTGELNEAYNRLNTAYEEMKHKDRIMRNDLKLAQKVQMNILTRAESAGIPDAAVHYQPLTEVGGDIYNIARIKPNLLRIFLADATGHGVPAALVTMLIKSEYESLKNTAGSPEGLLRILNNRFIRNYYNLSVFFTGIIADIDFQNRRIEYSSAGHPLQYVIGRKGLTPLSPSGKMVGVIEDASFGQDTVDFNPGDTLLLFTDGLFEEFNTLGEEWGEDRFGEYLGKFCGTKKDTHAVIAEILSDLAKFMDSTERNDDITVIALPLFG